MTAAPENQPGAPPSVIAPPEAEAPPIPRGVADWIARPRRWRRPLAWALGLLALVLAAAAGWTFLSPGSSLPPSSRAWQEDPDSVWTQAESERLGSMEFFRTADLGAGPPPFAFTPGSGPGSVAIGSVGTVRRAYDQGLAVLRGRPWETRLSDAAQADPVRDATGEIDAALIHLQRANQQANDRNTSSPESAARYYHLALAVSWRGSATEAMDYLNNARMGGEPMCPDDLSEEDPAAPPSDEVTRRRGAQIACLWLRGRLSLLSGRPQHAVSDLGRALSLTQMARADYTTQRVGAENLGTQFVTFAPSVHLIDGSSASLWRDYLVAILAQEQISPPVTNRGESNSDTWQDPPRLETLRQDGDHAFLAHPDLAALARMVALRRGQVQLAREIPAGQASNLAAQNLNNAVEIIAGAGEEMAELDSAVIEELTNWQAHRCRRELVLDGRHGWGNCPGRPTPGFAAWQDDDWLDEVKARRRVLNGGGGSGDSWLFVFLAVLAVAAGWAVWHHGGQASAFRERRYKEVMGSRHRANALETKRPRYTPAPPARPTPTNKPRQKRRRG